MVFNVKNNEGKKKKRVCPNIELIVQGGGPILDFVIKCQPNCWTTGLVNVL